MSNSVRCTMLLSSIAIVASCAFHQSALTASPEDGQSRAKVRNSQSCFVGPYDNFDSWLNHLRESVSKREVAIVEKRIGEERYDHAKSALDCQRFQYLVGDITVEGFSIRPASSPDGELPVIIYNRGGNAAHSRLEFRTLFQRLFPLAEQGFFVMATQYRGSGLKGQDINAGKDEFGGADVDDVMALFDLIDDSPFADESRIGMFGWSRGAIMSFLAATRTDRLSALVVGGAPTDIEKELEARPKMESVFEARMPNYSNDKKAALDSRSVLRWADRLPNSLPILILHGASDRNVTLDSALNFARELQTLSIPYRLVVYENGSHSLLNHRESVNDEIASWFDSKLRK